MGDSLNLPCIIAHITGSAADGYVVDVCLRRREGSEGGVLVAFEPIDSVDAARALIHKQAKEHGVTAGNIDVHVDLDDFVSGDETRH